MKAGEGLSQATGRTIDGDDARGRLVELGEIALEIAHELRNSLQIISANVYLARQYPEKNDAVLTKIERHARVAQAIVEDLLTLARPERLAMTSTTIAALLDDARADLPAPLATYHDDVVPRDLAVSAHAGLLVRLFRILFDNATLASAPRLPTIHVRAHRDTAGEVVIDVEDDGPGIPEAIAQDIFEPLISGRPGGTGLGLALARRIVLAHGGTIALVPTDTGVGARFRVELPA